MLTGSEEARSRISSAFAPKRRRSSSCVVLGAGRGPFHRPQPAGALLDVRPLVLEVMAVAHIGHVHRLRVGRALVIGHALVGVVGLAVLHLQQRAVREHDVIAVAGIVVGELPVALELEPVRLADRDLAAGLAVEPFVDRLGDGAEIVDERRRIGIERREDEAAIAVDARHLRDVELRVLEVAGIAVRPRHRAQLAGVEVAPAVIGAGEDARRALVLAAQRGAAMGAAVEQRADLAVRVAQQDDRAQAQPRRDVVVVVRDLALVAEIDPDRAEDVGHLGLEDRRIGVDQPMDAILLHQLVPVVEVGGAFDPARRSVRVFPAWRSVLACACAMRGTRLVRVTLCIPHSRSEKIEILVLLPVRRLVARLATPASFSHCSNRPASLRLSLRK